MTTSPVRVTVLAGAHLRNLPATHLDDALDYFDPDALLLADVGARRHFRQKVPASERRDRPVLVPGESRRGGEPAIHHVGETALVVPTSAEQLAAISSLEGAQIDPATETYVFTDKLSVSLRLTSLSADLDGGDAYREALDPSSLRGSYTHVSTGAPVDYYREWDALRILGAAPGDEDGTNSGHPRPPIPTLSLSPDGLVSTHSLKATRLGLRALSGVGKTTARTLTDAGIRTREAVADADLHTLSSLEGLGSDRATQIREHARAITSNIVVCRDSAPVPDQEPIFVDVETDGLTPTIVWLIGALDRTSDEYRSFVATDPDDPAAALRDFFAWYIRRGRDRPLVAYNGNSFDFDVLEEHARRHCPEHESLVADARTFDPYAWAVRNDHAFLPGLTNKLEDVAAALGMDLPETGLDGAAVARIYRNWMQDQAPDHEPEWERHETYCEADVRALAGVYDAIADAAKTTETEPRTNATEETAQGKLTDF
jgi:uncharacterized protein YprB with RNaseH-like and TPR domain